MFLFLIPESELLEIPSICLVKYLTGLECLGCGMTRAFWYILHGEFSEAWKMNPLVFVVSALFPAFYLKPLIQSLHLQPNKKF
ncbi:MAG: DUF2752 domain-containing protein [Leptospira sp.]|nr:DUF2752 domain-containing protein [Leptospira sp.]